MIRTELRCPPAPRDHHCTPRAAGRAWAHRLAPVLLVLLGTLATGCTVGPDYQPPRIDTGDGWSEPVAVSETARPDEAIDLGTWWHAFDDATLDDLIERALEQNLDVRQATTRVAEARALRDAVVGRRLPAVDASANVAEQRLSENGSLPIRQIPGFDRDQTVYDIGFDSTWEADLFGRVRRSIEAADARLAETVELRRGARISVAAEVARVYQELRGAERRLDALESALEAARDTHRMVGLQVEAGEVARARLAQSEADLTALEARLPGVRSEIRASALSLGVLLGELPEAGLELVADRPEETDDASWTAPALPVGQRADLLRRRPDVRAAERALAAATADIGVATAELFPRLTISAAGGFQAMDLGNLVTSGSETWSIVPFLSWRIFDGGRVRAQIRASEARAEAAALAYEQAVKEALADAERSLVRYRHDLEALDLQAAAVEAARRNREYARLRYEAGDTPLFELLDAERVLASAREGQAATRTRVATGLVALFKALGGGWEEVDYNPKRTASPQATNASPASTWE